MIVKVSDQYSVWMTFRTVAELLAVWFRHWASSDPWR